MTDRWLRPELRDLPTYGSAVVCPPAHMGAWYKLSSNENPYAPSEAVIEAIGRAARSANRYPDPFGDDLAAVLAEHHHLPPDRVAVAGGSLVLLQQVVQAVASPGDEVAFGWRSYEAYPIVVQSARCTRLRVPLRNHCLDLEAISARVTARTRLAIVCSPNNPTGTDVSASELEGFAETLPPGCLLVLDEAYREFSAGPATPDGLGLQERLDHVLVLRTFSKAHNLAGARIGWCAGDPEILRAMRRVALPFTVSRLASAAAAQAIADYSAANRLEEIISERERLAENLRGAGFEVPASQTNFLWLVLGDRSDSFAARCAESAVSVRCFSGEGVRVTVGTAEANDRVAQVANSFARQA
jgi:histidinol-phosphate aminotransferase